MVCVFSGIPGRDTFETAVKTCTSTLPLAQLASVHTDEEQQLLLSKATVKDAVHGCQFVYVCGCSGTHKGTVGRRLGVARSDMSATWSVRQSWQAARRGSV